MLDHGLLEPSSTQPSLTLRDDDDDETPSTTAAAKRGGTKEVSFPSKPSPRRFIFGRFPAPLPPASPPPALLRRRSSSLSVTECSAQSSSSPGSGGFGSPCAEKKIVSFADLPPTPPRHALLADHFKAVQDLPAGALDSMTGLDLPPLPTPMQRLYYREQEQQSALLSSSGIGTTTPPPSPRSPRPILHQSSYHDDTSTTNSEQKNNESTRQQDVKQHQQQRSQRSPSSTTVAGTETQQERKSPRELQEIIALAQSVMMDDTDDAAATATASCCSSSSSTTSGTSGGGGGGAAGIKRACSVQFDPRVTVTEYQDDQERDWYNDKDMERFKFETIQIARKYLSKHPDQVDAYKKPVQDPVTGASRTKAIFALPGLGAESDADDDDDDADDDDDDDSALQKQLLRDPKEMQALCEREVRSILIVDPRRRLAAAYRPTFREQFPRARITVLSSAEDALHSFAEAVVRGAQRTGTRRGYDVVLSDQKLDPPAPPPGVPARRRRLGSPEDATAAKTTSTTIASKASKNSAITGADLFRSIVEFEKIVHDVFDADDGGGGALRARAGGRRGLAAAAVAAGDDHFSGAASSGSAPPPFYVHQHWRSLLVAVSAQPDEDAAPLRMSGADFVCGSKSPVGMGRCIRNQLVQALVQKRCHRPHHQNGGSITHQ